MVAAVFLIAALAAFAAYAVYRREQPRRASPAPAPSSDLPAAAVAAEPAAPAALPPGTAVPGTATATAVATATGPPTAVPAPALAAIDPAQIEAGNNLAADRLWRLAFGVQAQFHAVPAEHAEVRDAVVGVLRGATLDPRFFPRRPTLMSQLIRAVNDPGGSPEKITRIIAHDPVLTADVLRLANSSLYRVTPVPATTIQRAIVVCGVNGLQGLVAAALLHPEFKATPKNYPRFPRMLWERTERTSRAAELYALRTQRLDRFEAQMVALLAALGPLTVYRAALNVYARTPTVAPNGALFVALIGALGGQMSQRIAANWQTSPPLLAALDRSAGSELTVALHVGELLGTLATLEAHHAITPEESFAMAKSAGLSEELIIAIGARLAAQPKAEGVVVVETSTPDGGRLLAG